MFAALQDDTGDELSSHSDVSSGTEDEQSSPTGASEPTILLQSDEGEAGKYSREFLLGMRELFKSEPQWMNKCEIVVGCEDLAPQKGARSGKGKGGRDRNGRSKGKGNGRGRRDRSRDPGPAFTGPVVPLEVTENRWQKKEDKDQIEQLTSDVLAILNKITPEKFDILFGKMMELDIANMEGLQIVINCIFDKALMEPAFCPLYATLCARFSQELPDVESEDGQTGQFRRVLLNKCQQEFEKEGELAEIEDEEERGKMKRRMLGNIKFIGELYLKKMLGDKIMFFCIQNLAMHENPDEEDIEALCNLITTIGATLEVANKENKQKLDQCFGRLQSLKDAKPPVLQSRIRFMIQDLIELRASRWRARNQTDGPATLKQVRSTKQEDPHAAAARKAKRSGGTGVQDRKSSGSSGHGESNRNQRDFSRDSGDGWETAGSKPKGRRQDKKQPGGAAAEDEWEVAGSSNKKGRGQQGRANNRGKGGRQQVQDVRQLAPKQAPKQEPKVVSNNAFALMDMSDSEEENSEEESEIEEEPEPVSPVDGKTDSATDGMDASLFEKKICSILDEYMASSDEVEACECVEELEASDELLQRLVTIAVMHVMESKDTNRTKVNTLLAHLCNSPHLTGEQATVGIKLLMDELPDLGMDVPMFGQYVAYTIGTLIAKKAISPSVIKEVLVTVEGSSQGARMLVWLFDCAASVTNLDEAKAAYADSGINGIEMLHEDDQNQEEVDIVLKRSKPQNEMGWLFQTA